uniref:Uncharacterized protein n=1 Tax=Panagrolaimus sp. JU765 TaxID=591449 RepID=A0AC34PVC1_9BILA
MKLNENSSFHIWTTIYENSDQLLAEKPICGDCLMEGNKEALNRIEIYEYFSNHEKDAYFSCSIFNKFLTISNEDSSNYSETNQKVDYFISRVNYGMNIAFVTDIDLPREHKNLQHWILWKNLEDEQTSKTCFVSLNFEKPKMMNFGDLIEFIRNHVNDDFEDVIFTQLDKVKNENYLREKIKYDEILTLF